MSATLRYSANFDTARRNAIREALGLSRQNRYRIVVVEGDAAPKIVGRSYYWTTLSGKTEVRYPNAYKWPTLYHGSTLRIVVGAAWNG